MKFDFDPNKDAINIAKHQLSLADAAKLDWMAALVWVDNRQDYGELRQVARRIISLRKANNREYERYEQETN
jgi:hypothetical protein